MNYDLDTLTIHQPLWLALSDLFLDTELQEYNFVYIAKAMSTSHYSLIEIEDILMVEVFPVCIANLHSVVGDWAGFDENWICNSIRSAKRLNRYRRWANRRNFWMIEKEWEKALEVYKQI